MEELVTLKGRLAASSENTQDMQQRLAAGVATLLALNTSNADSGRLFANAQVARPPTRTSKPEALNRAPRTPSTRTAPAWSRQRRLRAKERELELERDNAVMKPRPRSESARNLLSLFGGGRGGAGIAQEQRGNGRLVATA